MVDTNRDASNFADPWLFYGRFCHRDHLRTDFFPDCQAVGIRSPVVCHYFRFEHAGGLSQPALRLGINFNERGCTLVSQDFRHLAIGTAVGVDAVIGSFDGTSLSAIGHMAAVQRFIMQPIAF